MPLASRYRKPPRRGGGPAIIGGRRRTNRAQRGWLTVLPALSALLGSDDADRPRDAVFVDLRGGVNRHVEALAEQFLARGDEVRVLAPWDPPDRLSSVLHRAPASERSRPDYLVPLGRTIGLGANGAVSNLSPSPGRSPRCVASFAPDASTWSTFTSRSRRFSAGTRLVPRRARGRDVPRVLDQARPEPAREPARRAPQVEPARGADSGIEGGRMDRPAVVRRRLPDHPQRRRRRCAAREPQAGRGRAAADLRRTPRGAQGPPGPAFGLRGAGPPPSRAPHRDRRRSRRRLALPHRPEVALYIDALGRVSGETLWAPCTRPTSCVPPRSTARALEWS